MKTRYLFPILGSFLLWNCSKNQEESYSPVKSSIELYTSKGVDVKMSFARVLSKAIANPAIHRLLVDKTERQFDKDYDVLYHQIKNEVIDGRPLESYIKELSNESDYALFNKTPLLNIFIPHIQQSTNAKTIETPWVAVRNQENKIIAYNAAGDTKELDEKTIPSFPVVVVKENERVVYENNEKSEDSKSHFIFESDGNRYFFSHDEFDGNNKAPTATKEKSNHRITGSFNVDPTVKTAYNNSLTCNTCPQRDFVYYGIYPAGGVNEGSMDIKYSEAITSVTFENTNVFSTVGGWDEGNYELYINVFFSGAATGVFSSVLKVISVSPNQMFEFDSNNNITNRLQYQPSPAITIAPWDMKAYGNKWAFKVEEYDPEVKKTGKHSHTSTFGTNFKTEVSGGIGKVVKVGAEFGLNTTSSTTNEFTYETTDANDILGGAILSWTDPIMKRETLVPFFFYILEIAEMGTVTTGTTEIGVETIRIMP